MASVKLIALGWAGFNVFYVAASVIDYRAGFKGKAKYIAVGFLIIGLAMMIRSFYG